MDMAAKILKFPQVQTVKGYKIPLYTDEEIELTLLVTNHYGNLPYKVNQSNLKEIEPVVIIKALTEAKTNRLFSFTAERLIRKILSNVEEISMKEYM